MFTPCPATFSWEVSQPVLLKVTTEDFLEVKNINALHFWFCCSKSKKEECNQKYLNVSDQCETLVPCSVKYFLGMSARHSQKLSTKIFCIDRKTSRFTIIDVRILNKNIGLQPDFLFIFPNWYLIQPNIFWICTYAFHQK